MEAAEAIFDGKFDDLKDQEDDGGDQGGGGGEDEEMPDFNSDDDQGSDAYDDDEDMNGVGDMGEYPFTECTATHTMRG